MYSCTLSLTSTLDGWSTQRPATLPRERPGPIVREAGWAPGPVWQGAKNLLHRDSIPGQLVLAIR